MHSIAYCTKNIVLTNNKYRAIKTRLNLTKSPLSIKMKLTLPLHLRKSLLALLLLTVTCTHSKANERIIIDNSTKASDILFNNSTEQVTINFTGEVDDLFPSGVFQSYDDIFVQSWIMDAKLLNYGEYEFQGKIHGSGNIMVGSENSYQSYNFSGDMSEFSGNITSNVGNTNFNFTGSARSAASGTGAISITHQDNTSISFYFESGNTTIVNSSITANHLRFDGVPGSNYNVDSTITANQSISIGFETSVTFSSSVNTHTLIVYPNSSLSVSSEGSLTINGLLHTTTTITNEGSVIFGDNAIISLGGLMSSVSGKTTTYSLISGGNTSFGNLDWTNIRDVFGLTASSHQVVFDDAAGTVSLTLIAAELAFSGSSDTASPKTLNWTVGGDRVFTEGGNAASFEDGAIVTFSGHTNATLSDDINLSVLTLSENSSLVLSEGNFSFSTGGISLDNNSHLTLSDTIDSAGVPWGDIRGAESATLTLNASDEGTTLNIALFSGTVNLNSGHTIIEYDFVHSLNSLHLESDARVTFINTDRHYDLNLGHITGSSDSTITIDRLRGEHGQELYEIGTSNLDISDNFKGILEITGGLISLEYSNLGGTKSIILNNSGLMYTRVFDSLRLNKDITIASGSIGYVGVDNRESSLDITGLLSGDNTTTLTKIGDELLTISGDASAFKGSIAVSGGKIITESNIENAKSLFLSAGTTFEVAYDVGVTTLGDYNISSGSYSSYERRTDYDYTITVQGHNANFNDNVHLRQAGGSVSVNGEGFYRIESYVGGDKLGASHLLIDNYTTMEVRGTTESNDASGRLAAFSLTHSQNGTVDISGRLILNSGISNQDATGTLNVREGGTLELREGLYGVSKSGTINLNVAERGTLLLSNQTIESSSNASDSNINTNIASGATITAASQNTNILNTLKLSGTGSIYVNAEMNVLNVNFKDVISNAEGSNAGLFIRGLMETPSGELRENLQTFILSAANTYSGNTRIETANLEVGNASAFGSGGTVTLLHASLNLNNHAIANDIIADSSSLSGFSAFAGKLQVKGAVDISGTTTGSITVSDRSSLTMEGTWDYSSAINIGSDASLTFNSDLMLDLTDIAFTQSGENYSLNLFTGTGTADIDSWLSSGAVDLSKITGLDSSITTLNYSNGVLSYIVQGDILISDTDKTLSGQTDVNVIFEEGSTGRARLNTGFTQEADSGFFGAGTILIEAGADVTLDNASVDFSGMTEIQGRLTINDRDALGTSSVEISTGSTLSVGAGVSLSNDVTLGEGATVNVGTLTISGQAEGSSITGASKTLTHIDPSTSNINSTTLTNTRVDLVAGAKGVIENSTLTSTHVQLAEKSELTLSNVHQGLGSSLNGNEATVILNDHTIDDNVSTGTLTHGLSTNEGSIESMLVYSLTSLNVGTVILNNSLTLNLIVSDADKFTAQIENGIVAFEIGNFTLGGLSLDQFNMGYGDIMIHVYDGSLEGTALFSGTALGTTTLLNSNLAIYIPEPSTVTMSLLALAGLLARRRRKAA